ncbi:MAG TPA: sigma-70 family RNA polymerase sigma factor, partial [Thermoanaerobaculia bacterium]|nr:sigma-70 family RNA polymerase sigma factor [Thermoanaerobaculia bacterium]
FGRLVVAHQRAITRLAYRILADADLADGVAQETFLRAWQRRRRFRGDGSFAAWLARIAVNLCRDQLRRKRLVWSETELPHPSHAAPGPLAAALDGGPSPETASLARDLGRRIAAAMAALPRQQREVFALRFYDELPLAEIAAALRLDLGTVKTHLFRATRRVRQDLEAVYGTLR